MVRAQKMLGVKLMFKKEVKVVLMRKQLVLLDKAVKFKKLEAKTTDMITFPLSRMQLISSGCCIFGGGQAPEKDGQI